MTALKSDGGFFSSPESKEVKVHHILQLEQD